MEDKLQKIIDKLGFNPVTYTFPKVSATWDIDDRDLDDNPYRKLSEDELDFVINERVKYLRSKGRPI